MIFLRKPYIKKSKNKSKLIFDLEVDGEEKSVWFEVDKEYEIYLCDDRVDPILVGVLSYAMRKGHDIKTDSYITDDILFRVQEYLIPALIKGSSNLKKIKIEGKTKKALSNVGAVGTGCSCGIDSIHAYVTKTKQKSKKFNLTHLCINNVGAFNECYGKNEMDNVRKKRIQKSKEFAREVQLPLIITDSNFQTEIPQMHHLTHTYSSAFAILCLQKLWGIYYYGSSGMGIDQFSVKDNDKKDCESYELLSLDCFSTSKLKIYSEGMCQNRLEKTEDIYQHDLLKKYPDIFQDVSTTIAFGAVTVLRAGEYYSDPGMPEKLTRRLEEEKDCSGAIPAVCVPGKPLPKRGSMPGTVLSLRDPRQVLRLPADMRGVILRTEDLQGRTALQADEIVRWWNAKGPEQLFCDCDRVLFAERDALYSEERFRPGDVNAAWYADLAKDWKGRCEAYPEGVPVFLQAQIAAEIIACFRENKGNKCKANLTFCQAKTAL